MKAAILPGILLGLAVSTMALAQSSTSSSPQPSASPGNQSAAPKNQNAPLTPPGGLITRQKLTQDLQNAGFSDVKVVEEAFVVQAKTKEGNPIVMTIGPNGMSAIEAITNAPSSTGSTAQNSNGTQTQK